MGWYYLTISGLSVGVMGLISVLFNKMLVGLVLALVGFALAIAGFALSIVQM